MATKMHELLAAENNVNAIYNSMLDETIKVLDSAEKFTKTATEKIYFKDEDSKLNTYETKDKTTTVTDRLEYFFGRPFVNAFDTALQKDATNQVAKADLIVNGEVLVRDVPATALLSWEGKFDALRRMLLKIPTLRSGPEWVQDESEDGLWKTKEPVVTFSTKKTMVPVILHPPTEQHPAQVDKVFEDIPVAKSTKTEWSGMWTAKRKADTLARLDTLLVGIKKARQRANRVDILKPKAGNVLANFILKGPEADALTGGEDES